MAASNWEKLKSRLKAAAVALKERQASPEDTEVLIQETVGEATNLMLGRQYDVALDLLASALDPFPDHPKVRRCTALVYGGKAEYALGLADALQVALDPAQLMPFRTMLNRAIQLDPEVADVHWDLAVIEARFSGDFAAAARHLADAKQLGYQHPKMQQLEILIERKLPPTAEESGETQLKRLIWTLALWPDSPPPRESGLDGGHPLSTISDPFEAYCVKAAELVRAGALDATAFERVRQRAAVFKGDASEYAADLLRVTAAELADIPILARATHDHLRILAQMSFELRGRVAESSHWLLRARKAATRGLQIIAEAKFDIDPDLHADLLLALGQTYTHPSNYQLREGMHNFLKALDLKEAAGNAPDTARLRDLLRKMIQYVAARIVPGASGLGGVGMALEDLKVGYAAAKRIGDVPFAANVGVALAEAYSVVHQSRLGEEVINEILMWPEVPEEQRIVARFQLASALSESGRADAALEIQTDMLAEADRLFQVVDPVTFWMNLGNSRRVTGKLEAAREAFGKAVSLLKPPGSNEVPLRRGHILSLLGHIEFLLGNDRKGTALFKEAEACFGDLPSLESLRFHSLAGEQFFKAGQLKRSQHHFERARHLLEWHLEHASTLPVWESMLQSRAPLDAYEVESFIHKNRALRLTALVRAESAKGRLLAWLRNHGGKTAVKTLSEDRHQQALETVQQWTGAAKGRVVLSLFAAERGLAVFSLGVDGGFCARWIEDFRYEDFRTEYFEPWEETVSRSIGGEQKLWPHATMFTHFLLDRIGEWLWRAAPELSKGGEELVIVPHRLFRSLPLAHCRLPRNQRLSDLFQRVTIAPSLFDLGRSLGVQRHLPARPPMTALVDPDATLPCARLEGFCAAGRQQTHAQHAATFQAMRQAVGAPGIVLVSAHGYFDEQNPWLSTIRASDTPLELRYLVDGSLPVQAHLLVLGVCEAGKTRRSLSDEPLGFPSVLVQSGVTAVVAPMWKVDDFASLFFISHLFDRLGEQMTPARALLLTARWMQRLQSSEALVYLDGLLQKLNRMQHPAIDAALADTREVLERNRRWLERLPTERPPFRSPLDWAAFQVVGTPF